MKLPTSPTSQSALLSGAAKDDAVGLNGDYTFKISDLLANDPGGAAKLGSAQFFFGDTAADKADQAGYLAAHNITYDQVTQEYTIHEGATNFSYFVQIGNKGTWSQADVDVTAPVHAAPHAGALLFSENFDDFTGTSLTDPSSGKEVALTSDLAQNGWIGTGGHTELGDSGYGGIGATSGNHWLDTQNSPGGINIAHGFNATGDHVQVTLDIATQSLDFNGAHYATDPLATLALQLDGQTVATFTHNQVFDAAGHQDNVMHQFSATFAVDAGAHTLSLVDTSQGYTGFAVDTLAVHDWIV